MMARYTVRAEAKGRYCVWDRPEATSKHCIGCEQVAYVARVRPDCLSVGLFASKNRGNALLLSEALGGVNGRQEGKLTDGL